MKVLAIDTTTMFGSVALCDGAKLIAEEQMGVDVTHSDRLVATIEHLLTLSRWKKEDIEGIAVATGPGSFTGLRIGLATAKGLALGLKRPIAGASSLLTLAYNAAISDATVVSIIDARRAQVYAAAYRFREGKEKCVLKEGAFDPEPLCRKLGSIKGPLVLVGDGVVTYEKLFRKELGKRALIRPDELKFPRGFYLAQLATARLKRGGDDITELVPNYLRHSDAEIGFKKTKQQSTAERAESAENK